MMRAMGESPKPPSEPGEVETLGLIDRAVRGDQEAWGELLARHRDRLRRMVAMRLDRRLQGRVDASDVIQDAMLEASRRLAEYRQDPTMPFFLWLRYITGQRLLEQHRRHLGAQGRDAGREISLYRGAMPETTTAALAAQLLGRHTSPSQAAQRAERKIRLQESLNSLDPLDREILALAALRAPLQRRGRRGAGPRQVGREQALRPRPHPAQGHPGEPARRARRIVNRNATPAPREPRPWPTKHPRRPRPPTATRSSGWPTRSSPGSAPANGPASRSTPSSTPSWPARSASSCRPWSSSS